MKELKKANRTDGATLHIVNRGTNYQPFVVCWNFNGKDWDWGTYCHTYEDAERVFQSKLVEFGFY